MPKLKVLTSNDERSHDIGPDYYPLLASDVLIFRRGPDTILRAGATGMSYVFNETAALILSAADGKTSVKEIVDALCRQFDVDPKTALADVQAVIRESCKYQLLGLTF